MTAHLAPRSSASSSKLAPVAAIVTAMLSVSSGASIAKSLFPVIGAAGTTALRLGIAAILLACAFRVWRGWPGWRPLAAAVPYGLSLGCMNLLFYKALQHIPLGIAIAIEFIGPLSVAVISSRRRADFGWIALAVAGLVLLLPLHSALGDMEARGGMDAKGVGLALAAGFFWGAYILTGKRAGAVLGARASAFGTIIAAGIVLPFGIAEAGPTLLAPHVLAVASSVGLLSSAIPYSLEMMALRRLPAKTFGILASGEPAAGAVMGTIFLGEALPLVKWLGIAAIITASVGTATGGTETIPAEEGQSLGT